MYNKNITRRIYCYISTTRCIQTLTNTLVGKTPPEKVPGCRATGARRPGSPKFLNVFNLLQTKTTLFREFSLSPSRETNHAPTQSGPLS